MVGKLAKAKTAKPKPAAKKAAKNAATGAAKPAAKRPVLRRSLAASPGGPTVTVVNIIPRSLSGETNQDSEPNIAVNPQNPDQIVATAFTPDPAGGNLAPLFVSVDGGRTWTLNSIVPSSMPNREAITGDISVAFSPASNAFYAGILRFPAPQDDTRLSILRATDVSSSNEMEVLSDRIGVDQPFVIGGVSNIGGKDRVYVGDNDLAVKAPVTTSTIDVCLDALKAETTFKSLRVDSVAGTGQNGPQIRPACHSDGSVYVAFYRWLARSGSWQWNTLTITADVVVVRDDNGASGATPFTDLKDTNGSSGRRVAAGVQFPFNSTGAGQPGQQRRGGDIAIAVDPTNSSVLYLAWAAVEPATGYTLHLRRSDDRGVTWSSNDLRTIQEAINPALAVNSAGQVGFLYQQLTGDGASQRWVTHFRQSQDATFGNWSDIILASVPANAPPVNGPGGFDPYIGDYVGMVSVGANYYGVFSANNTPDPANFPNNVTFQRNHDFPTRKLLDLRGKEVAVSIDPFFFSITP
ncbi:hypothetical protein SBA4_5470009 [Candidatus Sulfopaludibacter sp. SbA4]|nr:hypothetical protein SBA4_5470009 [Candidatus Sulfopaludibacter sp. SbA4]